MAFQTWIAIFMIPLLILGMFGNLNLIYVTWKFKDLKNRNSYLVAAIAIFDFISEAYEWKKVIEIFLDKMIMRRVDCYHSIFIHCYTFNMSNVVMLFLGIDRFIALLLPVKYRTARTTPFIALAIGTGVIYSTAFATAGFIFSDDELIELCDQTMAYSPKIITIWNYTSVTIDLIVFVLNVIDYYLLRRAAKQRESRMFLIQMNV
uniref:G_PROTEIN_RECEP_F1_2 domain-containing protein n=1 Tax=Elaeophora elaphi TaxID=1147741 RepID=A0A0R3RIM6_9BILA